MTDVQSFDKVHLDPGIKRYEYVTFGDHRNNSDEEAMCRLKHIIAFLATTLLVAAVNQLGIAVTGYYGDLGS